MNVKLGDFQPLNHWVVDESSSNIWFHGEQEYTHRKYLSDQTTGRKYLNLPKALL
ncbi:MAG: hypothetical protein K0S07_1132, partial [Chlamydiales bacterium]|nr:hypothetical protein [Chlamydiales bacterium]